MSPTVFHTLTPLLALAAGALLGAWLNHCGAKGKSPLPPMPALPRRRKAAGPDDGDDEFPKPRSAKL